MALILLHLFVAQIAAAPLLGASSLQSDSAASFAWLYPRDENYPGCPPRKSIIGKLVLYQFTGFLPILLFGHRRIARAIRSSLPWNDRDDERYIDLDNTIEWDMVGLYANLAWMIGFTYLTAIITRPPDTEASVWQFFQLWAIQPRVVPIIMILGYFRGWTGKAMTAVIVDSIVSIIAIQFQGTVAIMDGEFQQQHSGWPPYRIGAVMSLVPTGLLAILGAGLLVILLYGAIAMVFMYACICCLKIFRVKTDKVGPEMEWETKEYVWYTGYLVIHLIMYIGRWMMWSNMPRELYCPVWSGRVDLIWGLGPFGEELLAALLIGVFGSG